MPVNIGDRFLLKPSYFGSNADDDKKILGTVIAVYPKFALIDFGTFKECFPYDGPDGLFPSKR